MKKVVPHAGFFQASIIFDRISFWAVITSTLMAALSLIANNIHDLPAILGQIFDVINCVAIFFAFLFQALSDYFFFTGSKVKRAGFIDNSLGSAFVEKESQLYFSNDNIPTGIYKMAINCFENIFFTSRIASKMIVSAWIKTFILATVFIVSAATGDKLIIITLFQVSLPLFLVQNSIKLTLFERRLDSLYYRFLNLFSDLKTRQQSDKEAEMILLVMEYQCTLSWASILTSRQVFEKLNASLTTEWLEIKHRYGIPT